ncbi:helix-turn-helix transcriptional regulator [Paenibacillus sp. NRS-1782]|uniref:helix-turn-helix transcriptional regulator n=1 Tax=unclassified Paenibacillus TaxID=185978 RepID=UPI003D28E823
MSRNIDKLAGGKESAEILGWSTQQVTEYNKRGKFPKPIQQLACGKIWLVSQIEQYKNARTYGFLDFEGREYLMQDQAEFTGRQLSDWQTEEGFAEFSAPAVDWDGNEYRVFWVLRTLHDNGEEVEDLSDLNWDKINRVEPVY